MLFLERSQTSPCLSVKEALTCLRMNPNTFWLLMLPNCCNLSRSCIFSFSMPMTSTTFTIHPNWYFAKSFEARFQTISRYKWCQACPDVSAYALSDFYSIGGIAVVLRSFIPPVVCRDSLSLHS